LKDADDDAEESVLESIDKIGNFYRGTICKLHRSPERGKVRGASGREIPFTFAHVTMAGTRRRFQDLREGLQVGYDLGWTSKGVRVHLIGLTTDVQRRQSGRAVRKRMKRPIIPPTRTARMAM
jgi:hypothetical protein